MTGTTWHLPDDLLAAYAGGRAGAADGSSVEQHVVRCARCRTHLNALVESPLVAEVWERVQQSVQAPRPSVAERLLRRAGMSPEDALLLWTAPAFRAPWLVASVVTLVFATVAALSSETRGLLVFVLVAPLVPVAGVALAYGPDADEAHEVTVPVPYSALRLVLLRTLAVVATTVPVTLLAGALLPGSPGAAVAWLAPCVAAVAATLALSTWFSVTRAAGGVAAAWAVLAGVLAGPASDTPELVLAPSVVPAYVVLAVASTVVLLVRGDRLTHLGGSS